MALVLNAIDNDQAQFMRFLGKPYKINEKMWLDKDGEYFAKSGRLPRGYEGPNEQLGQIFKHGIEREYKDTILEIAPLEQTSEDTIVRSFVKFGKYIMQDMPMDGNVPLIEISHKGGMYNLRSKGIGARLIHKFWTLLNGQGQKLYDELLNCIGSAAIATLLHEATLRFFIDSMDYRYAFVENNIAVARDYGGKIIEHYKTWAVLNKNTNKISSVLGQAKKIMLEKGADPTYILIPKNGLSAIAYRENERLYKNRGSEAIKLIKNGENALKYIEGLKAIEIPDFSTFKSSNGTITDPTGGKRNFGSWFYVGDFNTGSYTDYRSNLNYATKIPNFLHTGSMQEVNGLEMLDKSLLFGNDDNLHIDNHKNTIDKMKALKNTLRIPEDDVSDTLTISYYDKGWTDGTITKKYRMIQHIGEMQKHHLTEEMIQNMVTCCESHLSNLDESKKNLLNEFNTFTNSLNTPHITNGSDEEMWIAAVALSFTDGYENNHLLDINLNSRVPMPPRVGIDGLAIKKIDGTWDKIVKLNINGNNNSLLPYVILPESKLDPNIDPKDMTYMNKIMKPMGFGTPAGLTILDALKQGDHRGYDMGLLQKASDIHNTMLTLYSIFRDIFKDHEITMDIFKPIFFDSILSLPKRYIAWVSNLCLPFQMGIYVDVDLHRPEINGNGFEPILLEKKDLRTIAPTKNPSYNNFKIKAGDVIKDIYIGLAIDRRSLILGRSSNIVHGCNFEYNRSKDKNNMLGGSDCDSMHFLLSSNMMEKSRSNDTSANAMTFKTFESSWKDTTTIDSTSHALILNTIAQQEKNVGMYHVNTYKRFQTYKERTNFIKRMFALSIITHRFTKKTFTDFWHTNIVWPISFILDRPRQTFVMKDAVLVDPGHHGNTTAQTLYSSTDFTVGDDVERSEYFIKYTLKCGTVINDTKKLFKIQNALCSSYVSGGSVTYVRNSKDMEALQSGSTKENRDILVRAVPYVPPRHINTLPRVRDISGKWHNTAWFLTHQDAPMDEPLQISNALYYENIYSLTRLGYAVINNSANDPYTAFTPVNQPNTIVFRGLQYIYNTVPRRWEWVLRDTGPFELVSANNITDQCTTSIEKNMDSGYIDY
ncbi:MAG: hypothetical protein EOP34_03125 [Rickettsiales bacterium]|nr:MAG: hypothetical protein EOP34_03125 [Rickettsiales bacterium]